MPYLTTNTRLTAIGEQVEVYANPHPNVALVINQRGERHSVRVDILSDEPVVDYVVEVIEEPNLFNQI